MKKVIAICSMLYGMHVFAQNIFIGDNRKYGVKDDKGLIIIQPQYDKIEDFIGDYAIIRLNNKHGLINRESKVLIPPKYDFISVSNNVIAVNIGGKGFGNYYTQGGKWGLLDKNGKEIIAPKYDYLSEFKGGIAVVNVGGKPDLVGVIGGKFGVIDETGKEIAPLIYDDAYINNDTNVVFVSVTAKGMRGYLDKTGKEVVMKYSMIYYTHEGLQVVTVGGKPVVEKVAGVKITTIVGGKWGFIDAKTKLEVIPPIYDKVESFKDGKAKVKIGEKEFYIDKKGNEII